MHTKAQEEIANFQKTREELNLLKLVSKELRNFRKMLPLNKND
jgi:hypothetical protein